MEPGTRTQITVLLSGPTTERLAGLRWHWDPAMARRIQPHITVGYNPIVPADLETQLVDRTAALTPFKIRIGRVATWPDGGIYVPAVDLEGGLSNLRSALVGIERPAGIEWKPHVTLVHPHVGDAALAEAWESLSSETFPEDRLTIDTFSVITQRRDVWEVTTSISLENAAP